jgi:hypothetical protein
MAKQLNVGFNLNAPMPIDARMQVDTFATLDTIPVKYDRMTSYVLDEDMEYRYFQSTNTWTSETASVNIDWGNITGLITNQTDLINKFAEYALVGHTHPQVPPIAHTHITDDITDFDIRVDEKIGFKSPYITGLTYLGGMSIGTSIDVFTIAQGTGIKNEWAPALPFAPPVMSTVEFGPFVDVVPTYLGSRTVTYIGIAYDSLTSISTVVQKSTPFTPTERRDIIVLGFVQHIDNLSINALSNIAPQPIAGVAQLHDMMDSVGALNTRGNIFTAPGTGLTLDKRVGTIFKLGINGATNHQDPHNLIIDAALDQEFNYITQLGVEYTVTTNVDPNMLDNEGTLEAVAAGKFTSQRIYIAPDARVFIQYGQKAYDSIPDAVADFHDVDFFKELYLEDEAVFRAYLVVQQGVTTLDDPLEYSLYHLGKFSNIEGASFPITYQAVTDALGYIPEDVANKAIDFSTLNDVLYPSTKAVNDLVQVYKDKNVVFIQGAASTVWTIPHAMGKIPSLYVTDTNDNQIIGDRVDVDDSNMTITYINAIAGTAYLN